MDAPERNDEAIAEAYRRFPDSETDPVYAGACRYSFLEGYRFALKQRSKRSETA